MLAYSQSIAQRWYDEPMLMKDALWPHVTFYDKQIEVIHSVRDNIETIVPAANMMGKDFLCGFVVCWYFMTCYSPDLTEASVRIITTSVKADHLSVLWGEVSKFIYTSAQPLIAEQGGPWTVNDMLIRHVREKGMKNEINYVKGMVSSMDKLESFQGHHARNTLAIFDEASGIKDNVYEMVRTWAKKILVIGNPHPCNNFFYKGVKEGDLLL